MNEDHYTFNLMAAESRLSPTPVPIANFRPERRRGMHDLSAAILYFSLPRKKMCGGTRDETLKFANVQGDIIRKTSL